MTKKLVNTNGSNGHSRPPGNPTWFKGMASPNPNGRPPGERALAEAMRSAMEEPVKDVDGNEVPGNVVLGRYVRDLLLNFQCVLRDGSKLTLGPSDWVDLLKWYGKHTDGVKIDGVNINLLQIKGYTNWNPDEWDDDESDFTID